MKIRLGLALLVSAVLQVILFAAAPHQQYSDKQIADLIGKLGSDDFTLREQAEQRLLVVENATSALRQARKSNDPEVIRRAARILATRTQRQLVHLAKQLKADAEAGRADMLAERIVNWRGEDNEKCWGPLVQLSRRLVDLQRNTFKRFNSRIREPDFPAFTTFRSDPRLTILSDRDNPIKLTRNPQGKGETTNLFLARGHALTPGADRYIYGDLRGLLAASTDVLLDNVGRGFLLAGGDVSVHNCGHAVIVCDGTFVASSGIAITIIVASGNVRIDSAIDSVILTGGNVFVRNHLRNSTIYAGGTVTFRPVSYKWQNRIKDSEIKQRQKNVFGPIKFFDPASVGVVVESVPHAARVVRSADAFARAGLKPGDLITEFSGSPVPSSDAFRRLLRRCLVREEPCVLRVRRDGNWLNLRVSLKR